ncbi:uncharacterized protein LOC135850008 isoform X2 [Planococcus citri]|uniref:uncharacterized protein LOC135850008 isoform X2 n=1 Tax=Planococcus citri TaxID=170843 RepID=UPI0031F7F45E
MSHNIFTMINVLASLFLVFVTITELHAECSFSLNEHVPKTAIITSFTQQNQILYPNHTNTLKLATGGRIRLTCGDQYFKKKFKKSSKTKEVVARCNSKDIVNVENERIRLRELECEDFPSSTPHKKTEKKCHLNNTLFDIAFEVRGGSLDSIRACFDEPNQDSIYTWYDTSMLPTGHQSNVKRPQFVHDDLYRFPVSEVYTVHYQHDWFAKLLKSQKKADEYIKNDGQHFLSRGHLTAKADMVYGSEQSATFHYINVAPQWQSFNGGNWNRVEESVRKEIQKKDKRYRVVTGTHGIATLPDVNNNEQELYLYEDENKNPLLKVPKLFWKLVYDMNQDQGVVIIGVNNPYLKKIPSDYIICKNICNKIRWLPEFNKDNSKGYIYCCEMDEFLKVTGFDKSFMN